MEWMQTLKDYALEFTPLEFETEGENSRDKVLKIRIYSVGV